jgi:hypothetical protein
MDASTSLTEWISNWASSCTKKFIDLFTPTKENPRQDHIAFSIRNGKRVRLADGWKDHPELEPHSRPEASAQDLDHDFDISIVSQGPGGYVEDAMDTSAPKEGDWVAATPTPRARLQDREHDIWEKVRNQHKNVAPKPPTKSLQKGFPKKITPYRQSPRYVSSRARDIRTQVQKQKQFLESLQAQSQDAEGSAFYQRPRMRPIAQHPGQPELKYPSPAPDPAYESPPRKNRSGHIRQPYRKPVRNHLSELARNEDLIQREASYLDEQLGLMQKPFKDLSIKKDLDRELARIDPAVQKELLDPSRRSHKIDAWERNRRRDWKFDKRLQDGLRESMLRAAQDFVDKEEQLRQAAEEEERLRIEKQDRRVQDEKAARKAAAKPAKLPKFVRLPSASLMKLLNPELDANSADENERLVTIAGRDEIYRRDLRTLLPLSGKNQTPWLNDNIVNSWMSGATKSASELYRQTVPDADKVTPRYYSHNSNFFETVKAKGYAGVSRWARRGKVDGQNMFKCGMIIIPIHLPNHWTLTVIFPQKKVVRYYDSLLGSSSEPLGIARTYLQGELGNAYHESEWKYEEGASGRQTNGSDCGVFSCANALALFYSDEPNLIVPSISMREMRMLMGAVLLNGGFAGEASLDKFYDGLRLL